MVSLYYSYLFTLDVGKSKGEKAWNAESSKVKAERKNRDFSMNNEQLSVNSEKSRLKAEYC